MAMMGIYLLFPALDSWYPKPDLRLPGLKGLIIRNDPMRKIWSMASLSIACQIFTAPIAWYHFNTFPKYFLITNLIALPLTSIIMISSIAVMILTACGICPLLLVEINEKAIGLMTYCLGIIADM
jgi:competence protein ComEC